MTNTKIKVCILILQLFDAFVSSVCLFVQLLKLKYVCGNLIKHCTDWSLERNWKTWISYLKDDIGGLSYEISFLRDI